MKHTILSISGKPGLYQLVSRGRATLIVEKVDADHKRMPIFATDCVTSLNDIAIYTDGDDTPLTKIFSKIFEKEGGKNVSFNYKKAKSVELREYFASVIDNFDRDRVHDSDIKKALQWYDILVNNGITDFEERPESEAKDE